MAMVQPVLKPAPVVRAGELTREFVERYAAALNEPAWMTARRLEALRVFRDTAPPNRHDELWRRVDLSTFRLDLILSGITPANTLLDVARSELPPALREQGVLFTSLEAAAKDHAPLLEAWLMTQCVRLSDAYYAALHGVFMRYGTILYVPAGVAVEQPLRTTIRMAADQLAGFYHTLVILEEGAKATLIEDFASETGAHQVLYNGVVEIILAKGAELDYVSIQDWGRNVYNFSTERAKVGESATLHWVVGGLGSKFTKSLIEADLIAPHGTALLSGCISRTRASSFTTTRSKTTSRRLARAIYCIRQRCATKRARCGAAIFASSRRAEDRRLSGQPQPPALQPQPGRLHPRPGDRGGRCAVHAWQHGGPAGGRADLLSAQPGHPAARGAPLGRGGVLRAGDRAHPAGGDARTFAGGDRQED
jgi:hypothetical protein